MRAIFLLVLLLGTSGCLGFLRPASGPVGTYEFVDLDGRPAPTQTEPNVWIQGARLVLDETGEFTLDMAASVGGPEAPATVRSLSGRYTVDGDTIRLIANDDAEGVSVLTGTLIGREMRLHAADDPQVARFVRR